MSCSKCQGSGLMPCKTIYCYHCRGLCCYLCNGRGTIKVGYDECDCCNGSGEILRKDE